MLSYKNFKFILILIGVLFLFSSEYGFAQARQNFINRYWNSLLNDTSNIAKPQFIMYPTLGYAPETSWEFGFSTLYVFYVKRDTANRLNEINGFTFFTLENQYGLWFDHALYTDKNKWFFLGRFRLQSFPLYYHGIGSDSPQEPTAVVDANQIQIKERVLRQIHGNLYAGVEFDFQRISSVRFKANQDIIIPMPTGSEGSSNLGFGVGLIYDTRHNVLNVRDGKFAELAYLNYHSGWGSQYSFSTIISDNRLYKKINARDVLAIQAYGQFNYGETPFNQMALLGGESLMRGYYLGRYRDEKMMATQVEYRFLPLPLGFTKRWGAAVFASTGAVFNKFNNLNLGDFVVAGGGGIRFLLFPKKDIYTRADVAFTKEGPGFYIFIGEAF